MTKNYEKMLKTKRGWTKIPNAIRHDENLTSDAKVVIEELLSVSGDFHISESGIASSVHLSLERVKKAIRLLKSTGYIQLTPTKKGTQFIGYEWQISDIAGAFRKLNSQQSENPSTENPSDGKPADRKTRRPETQQLENPTTYQYTDRYTERYQYTNNQKRIDEHTNVDEERENQVQSLSPYLFPDTKEFFSGKGSSEATASPLQGEKPGLGNQVLSQNDFAIEQAFNRFCDVYPNLGDKDLARAAFLAIPDISNLCHQIANSVEWFEKSGKWNNWQTGQKNVSCPQAAKFLKRGDWQQYLKSGATMSEEDRLRAILAKNRNINN